MNRPYVEKIILQGRINIGSLLIMFLTWSKYSHGILMLSDGTVMDATLEDGVKQHADHRPRFSWRKEIDLRHYFNRDEMAIMYERAKSVEGRKYDLRYLRNYLINRRRDDESKFVCFELLVHALRGYVEFSHISYRVVARHIERTFRRLGNKAARHNLAERG